MKILIADDEKIERESLMVMLKRYYSIESDFEILEAENGEKCLKIMEEENIHLLFIDIEMPIISGLEVCHQIRKWNIKTKIIIVTAYSRFEYAREAIQYQVSDYLVKPYSMKTLAHVIEKLALPIACVPDIVEDQQQRDSDAEIVEMIKQFICTHYAQDITLDSISKHLARSKFYISRLFNELENESIKEYINNVRVAAAVRLLEKGHNVTAISYVVGYKEPTYFTKVFKKRMGICPSKYTNRILK